MSPPEDEDFDDHYFGDDDGDDFDPADECRLMEDGQCLLAGSEWCDFECPYRDSELFAGSRANLAKSEGR